MAPDLPELAAMAPRGRPSAWQRARRSSGSSTQSTATPPGAESAHRNAGRPQVCVLGSAVLLHTSPPMAGSTSAAAASQSLRFDPSCDGYCGRLVFAHYLKLTSKSVTFCLLLCHAACASTSLPHGSGSRPLV